MGEKVLMKGNEAIGEAAIRSDTDVRRQRPGAKCASVGPFR